MSADEVLCEAMDALQAQGWVTAIGAVLAVLELHPDLRDLTVDEVWDRFFSGVTTPVTLSVEGSANPVWVFRAEEIQAALCTPPAVL